MNDLTVEDLLLMLLARPGKPRDHSNNLDLFKTLFEREVGMVNLIFNLVTGMGIAFLTAIIGIVVGIIRVGDLDVALFLTAGAVILALIVTILFARRLRATRGRIRHRFLDLIRLYYYLDAVT